MFCCHVYVGKTSTSVLTDQELADSDPGSAIHRPAVAVAQPAGRPALTVYAMKVCGYAIRPYAIYA